MDMSFWNEIYHLFTEVNNNVDMSFYHTQDLLLHYFYTILKPQVQTYSGTCCQSTQYNFCAMFVVHFWSVFDIDSMPRHKDLTETSVSLSFLISHSTSVTQRTEYLQLHSLSNDLRTHTNRNTNTHEPKQWCTDIHCQMLHSCSGFDSHQCTNSHQYQLFRNYTY